jgi:hypothetical protein
MKYPALICMMSHYQLDVNRCLNRETGVNGFAASVQPAFGAASGSDHEVWAETFEGVLDAIDQSIAKKWYPQFWRGEEDA